MKRKIKSLHSNLIAVGNNEIYSLIMAIDDDGVAWEFIKGRWKLLPELPAREKESLGQIAEPFNEG